MRVLLLSPLFPAAGGIAAWTRLLQSWVSQYPEVELHHVDTGARWRRFDDLGFLKRLVGGSLQGIRDLVKVLIQFVTLRPQVLHLTTSGSLAVLRDIVVLAAARVFGIFSCYHIHFGRLPELATQHGWEWRLFSCAIRLANKVIAIDRATESTLKPCFAVGNLVLLPNAIDLAAWTEIHGAPKAGMHRLCYLGWVIPTKGLQELMEAWRCLNVCGWELVVAGPVDAQYQAKLEALAGAGENVCFLGQLPQAAARQLMQVADIFVLPSYTEAFPNVILEAMASATAIVTTNVGAIPEMLTGADGRPCGLVIAPKDAHGLAEALRRLMLDPRLRQELGHQARQKCEQAYDTKVVFAELLRIWKTSCAE